MTNVDALTAAVRIAWAQIPVPPAEDLKYLAWACGEDAWRAFVNIAPVAVDISAPGFLGCTPLLDLPPAAAAAYLGSYLLSLLEGLKFQEDNGVFYDVLTRAHVISCLSEPDFWQSVIRPHLPAECQAILVAFASYLASRRELLALPEERVDLIVALSKSDLPPPR
jgi:hypothetical protein